MICDHLILLISTYLYVYGCLLPFSWSYVYLYMSVPTDILLPPHICPCVSLSLCLVVHACMYMSMSNDTPLFPYLYLHIYTCVLTNLPLLSYVYIYTYVYIYIYTHVCICVFVNILLVSAYMSTCASGSLIYPCVPSVYTCIFKETSLIPHIYIYIYIIVSHHFGLSCRFYLCCD